MYYQIACCTGENTLTMENKYEAKIHPFLKWPGGKRWLISKHRRFFPTQFRHYYEPFLGSGAVFFTLRPSKATLSDTNAELINLFLVMRNQPAQLANLMIEHQEKHSNAYYYQTRDMNCTDEVQAAGRLLYLNRTCYNGMYRVNRNGHFNVPIGTKSNCIFDIDMFSMYSELLKNIELKTCDFEDVIVRAGAGDLIFSDPPYTISHNQNSFIKYNEKLFSWNDQIRLHNVLSDAKTRGVAILATNACFAQLKSLYEESGFYVIELDRHSVISGKADKRRMQKELLISSFPFNE